jgi:hypothetical protein
LDASNNCPKAGTYLEKCKGGIEKYNHGKLSMYNFSSKKLKQTKNNN